MADSLESTKISEASSKKVSNHLVPAYLGEAFQTQQTQAMLDSSLKGKA